MSPKYITDKDAGDEGDVDHEIFYLSARVTKTADRIKDIQGDLRSRQVERNVDELSVQDLGDKIEQLYYPDGDFV